MSGHCMRVTQRIVAPMSDQSVLSEQATVISITDEEWPLLRDVIEKMIKECQE